MYEVEVAGPPLCVTLYNGDGGVCMHVCVCVHECVFIHVSVSVCACGVCACVRA